MPYLHLPLVVICLGFATGIWLQTIFKPDPPVLLVGLLIILLCLGLAYYFRKRSTGNLLFLPIVCLTMLFLGALGHRLNQQSHHPNHYTRNSPDLGSTHQVLVQEALGSTPYWDRYRAKLLWSGQSAKTGRVLLRIKKDSLCRPLSPGGIYMAYGSLQPIDGPANPHQFDYSAFMANRQVHGQFRLSGQQVVGPNLQKLSVRTSAERLRLYLGSVLEQSTMEANSIALSKALLLGDRRQMDKDLYKTFARAGVVHLLAVSGLHVGIIYWILLGLLKPLQYIGLGRRSTLCMTIGALWAYALLTGLSPSVVRAVFMFSTIGLAALLQREGNSLNALLSAFFFLLLINPNWLFEIGFQLSFMAVFFILWLHPVLSTLWQPKHWFWRKLRDLLGVSLIAQLGVLPLCLFYFHQFPGLFWLSNLLILPLMSIVLLLGMAVLFSLLVKIMPPGLLAVYNELLNWIGRTVGWIADQEQFLLTAIPFNQADLWTSYAVIFGVLAWVTNRNSFRTVLMILGCLAFLSVQFGYSLQAPKNQLIIFNQIGQTALGVSQGKLLATYVASQDSYTNSILQDYAIGERLTFSSPLPLGSVVSFVDKLVLIVDRNGLIPEMEVDIILLRNDSRVAMDLLLKSTKPKLVIADASNYGNHIHRWQATCKALGVRFYNTAKAGALVLDQSLNSPLKSF